MAPRGVIGPALLAASLSIGCKSDAPAPTPGAVATTGTAAPPAAAESPAPQATEAALLAWLSPDATAAAFVDLDRPLDVALVAYLAGAPAPVEDLLRQISGARTDLDELLRIDTPAPSGTLGPLGLGALVPLESDPVLVYRIDGDPRGFEAALAAAGFERRSLDGWTTYEPKGAFARRVVLLDERTAALVSRRALGSGLSPLSAARDLPPSSLERQMAEALSARPRPVVEAAAGGPIVHLDAPEPLGGYHLSVFPWQRGGLDVRADLVPTGDAAALAEALAGRGHPGLDDNAADLARKVAFVPEGAVVRARLQVPGQEVQGILLGRGPGTP